MTQEELDRIEKVGMITQFVPFSGEQPEWQRIEKKALDALIAAARRSITRPISEAPRDGTKVFLMDGGEEWHVAWFHDGFWFEADDSDIILDPFEFIPIPEGE